MTRTTVDIDASVLRELKKRQQFERKTLGQLISELLAKALEVDEAGTANRPLRWVSKDLQPRGDLDDKDAVWSALDEP